MMRIVMTSHLMKKFSRISILSWAFVAGVAAISVSQPVWAQPAPPTSTAPTTNADASLGTYEELDPAAFKDLEAALTNMALLRKNMTQPEDVGTLVFTLWQHALLQDAKKMFGKKDVDDPQSGGAILSEDGVMAPRAQGVREIGLNGILYKGKDNWVVWLNGKRLAPNALPDEIVDLKVHRSHIDMKWFDSNTNIIFPIRLRPHQRFNLDSRIFLPGLTAEASAGLQSSTTGLQ